jgi:hypothetical protein
MIYDNVSGGAFAKHFVQTLQAPVDMGTPEFRKMYDTFAKRVLWMDSNVCEGAFQMNTAWYFAVPPRDPIYTEHSHDYDELIGWFGSNPDDPEDLGGVIEFSVGGEAHRLTKTTMIWLPGGTSHNPVRILEVSKPIFHFSIVTNPTYDGKQIYK